MRFVRDLFMGPGNKNWDLARILGAKAFFAFTFAFLFALIRHGSVPDWSALGVGYTGVLGGIAMLIMGKDYSTLKHKASEGNEG
jgi:hypothetical protein